MRKWKKAVSHAWKGTSADDRDESSIRDTTTFVNYRNHVSQQADKVVTNENGPFVAREEVKPISLKYHRNDPGPSVIIPESSYRGDKSLVKKRVKKPSKCEVRKCRGIKVVNIEADRYRELIMKVKELKKNVDEYETIKITQASEYLQPPVEKKIASTQTIVDDTRSALITLEHCTDEMTKLKKFFTSAAPKKLSDNVDRRCCEIVTPHVHTFLDGLSAIIQYSIERTLMTPPDHQLPSTSRESGNCDIIRDEKNRDPRISPQTITNAMQKPAEPCPSETFITKKTPRVRMMKK